jgi:hypothetical protein
MFTSRRSLATLAALALLMLVAATGCASTATGVSPGDRGAYQAARARWESQAVASYSWVVQRGSCECLPEWVRPLLVQVEDGVAIAVVDAATRQPIPSLASSPAPTVDYLFGVIADAIDRGAYRLHVQYDATYGYPRVIDVDYDEAMVDDEMRWEGRAFVRR